MEERSFLSTVANFPKASAAAQSSLLKKITKQSASHFNSPELHQHHQASVHNHFRRLRLKIFTLHQLLQSATSVAARKYNATLICQKRVPKQKEASSLREESGSRKGSGRRPYAHRVSLRFWPPKFLADEPARRREEY